VEALGERDTKTYSLYPVQDYWFKNTGFYTEFCDVHRPDCIRFRCEWWFPEHGTGQWDLRIPINPQELSGTDQRLKTFQVDGLATNYFAWVGVDKRQITVWDTKTKDVIWYVKDQQISLGDNAWYTNRYPLSGSLNIDVSRYTSLDVNLYADIACSTGGIERHFARMIMTIDYVPSVPPQPATVTILVKNRETARGISGAYVALKSGNQVVAQAYTDFSGKVVFHNVPAGVEGSSYTLVATASGFEDYSDAVDILPGDNSLTINMVPKPLAIPTEWIIAGGAVLVIAGVAVAMGMRGKGERVVVVR
jgi:hypothetical protein